MIHGETCSRKSLYSHSSFLIKKEPDIILPGSHYIIPFSKSRLLSGKRVWKSGTRGQQTVSPEVQHISREVHGDTVLSPNGSLFVHKIPVDFIVTKLGIGRCRLIAAFFTGRHVTPVFGSCHTSCQKCIEAPVELLSDGLRGLLRDQINRIGR